jgi:hypothetical protein
LHLLHGVFPSLSQAVLAGLQTACADALTLFSCLYLLYACLCHAGGLKLDSLLKLNDVKVTAMPGGTAGAAGTAPLPRRHSDAEQEQRGAAANGAAADAAAAAAAPAAAAGAEAEQQPLPPVKTLLEFVAWVVLQQEAEAAAAASSARAVTANGTSGAPSSSRSISSSSGISFAGDASRGWEQVGRSVKGGFLAQELSELALAVRRMQTGELCP